MLYFMVVGGLIALLGIVVWANVLHRRRRSSMTPEQRKDHDAELQCITWEW
jgi:hypothetical protein